MSLINVDYNSLEQSKKDVSLAISQCSSIASRISGVKVSIDGRVAARCGGLDGLISSFNSIVDKLEIFYEKLDNTIRFVEQLDEMMNSGFDLATSLEQLSLLQQLGLDSKDVTVQLKTTEEMLDLINKTKLSLEEDVKNYEEEIRNLKVDLNVLAATLLDKGYTMEDIIQSNEEYINLQKQIEEKISNQNLLQSDLSNLNNLKIVFDYQKKDLEYQTNAKNTSDFSQNNNYESILNEDGTINKEVMNAINAYRKEHNLIEITNEEEFKMIFGETTEEEWLQRAAISYDVFSAVNPLMVASAVNKNGYETGVDISNYLLADTYLTEEEKQTFNYYYNKEGRLKADEYLNFKLGELSNRKQTEENRMHQEKYNEYLNLGKDSNYDELSLRYYDRTLHLPEHLTSEEKQAAIYLYKTEGLSKYDEFIEFLDIDLKQREARIEADKAIEDFVNSGAFKSVKIGATGLGDGINNFFEGLKNATIIGADGEVSVNQLKSQYILEALMTDSRFIPYLDSGTYEISMGIGNMAPSIATSALISSLTANPVLGAKVGTTLMGVSSGGNSYENALMSGATQSQALLYGILSGSSEATLGYFLGNIPGISKESSSTLLGLLKEGGEEATQEIFDSIINYGVLGEEFEIDSENVLKSGVYGFITAGILNGLNFTTIDSIELTEEDKVIIEEINDLKNKSLFLNEDIIRELTEKISHLTSKRTQINALQLLHEKAINDGQYKQYDIYHNINKFSDDVKISLLPKVDIEKGEGGRVTLIRALSSDLLKVKCLNLYLSDEGAKAYVIESIKNEKLKVEQFKKLSGDMIKIEVEDNLIDFSSMKKYSNITSKAKDFLAGEMLERLKTAFPTLSDENLGELKGKTVFVPFKVMEKYQPSSNGYNQGGKSYVGIELGSRKHWLLQGNFNNPTNALFCTIMHENIHELVNIRDYGYNKGRTSGFKEYYDSAWHNTGINEVTTEYLTRVAMGDKYFFGITSYTPSTQFYKTLVEKEILSDEIIQSAYFNSQPQTIEKIINDRIGSNYSEGYADGYSELCAIMEEAYRGNKEGLAKLKEFINRIVDEN